MILYHGSDIEVRNPVILRDEKGRDFGYAFYVTPIKEQAEKMALRKRKFNRSQSAIVSVFEFDEIYEDLLYKNFKEPNVEWLNFIVLCRSKPNTKHHFDVIEGKIADDNVGETVLDVIYGKMSPEQAAEKLKFQKISSQLAFCTERSLKHLNFQESYEVK